MCRGRGSEKHVLSGTGTSGGRTHQVSEGDGAERASMKKTSTEAVGGSWPKGETGECQERSEDKALSKEI